MSEHFVKIISRESDKVLEVKGRSKERRAAIQQNSFTNHTHQQWEIVHTGRHGHIKIVSRHSGMIMVPNGVSVQQFDDLDIPDQQWRLEQTEDEYLAIISVDNGHALSLAEASSDNGVRVELQPYRRRHHQQWQLEVVKLQRID